MKESWYEVKGTTEYEEKDIEIIKIELLVLASSVEDACQRARDFLKPIAKFDPMECKWKDL